MRSARAPPRSGACRQEVIRAFSTRRAEIEERMAERGETSRRAAEMAALDTRRAKDNGVSAERLAADWRARAEELGFGARENEACLHRAFEREPDPRRNPSACSTSWRARTA